MRHLAWMLLLLPAAAGCLNPSSGAALPASSAQMFRVHSPSPADIPMMEATEEERMAASLGDDVDRVGAMMADLRRQEHATIARRDEMQRAMLLPEAREAMSRYYEGHALLLQDQLLSSAEMRDILRSNEGRQINNATSSRVRAYGVAAGRVPDIGL